jgi:hypothetical protein
MLNSQQAIIVFAELLLQFVVSRRLNVVTNLTARRSKPVGHLLFTFESLILFLDSAKM